MPKNRLGEALATYLYDEMDDLCDLESQIDGLADNGNVAFNQTDPQALLGILLGAHDEPPRYIGNLLQKLQKRMYDKNMPSTSVIISCNAPEGAQDSATYCKNIDSVKEFLAQPNDKSRLPVSFFEIAYPEGTTQGKRRRDLGNVAMMHAWRTYSPNNFPDKMSFMMLDVDTEDVYPGALTNLHARVMRGEPVVAPRIAHHVDSAYPRLARALRFEETLYGLVPDGGWDGYMMFDLATLADKGSYPAEHNMSEVQYLVHEKGIRPARVPKSLFTTSSRRIHAEFLAGQTFLHKCWPSFSTTESYRQCPPNRDIDATQMRNIALSSMKFARVYTLKRRTEAYIQDHKMLSIVAFSHALHDIAKQARVANYIFGIGIQDSNEYMALQDASKKYCIV